MRSAIEKAQPALDVTSGWPDLLLANLLIRLRELVDLASDCARSGAPVATGKRVPESGCAPIPKPRSPWRIIATPCCRCFRRSVSLWPS